MFVTWSLLGREDPANENECLCMAAITLLGCCHLANFDLFSSVRLIYKVREVVFLSEVCIKRVVPAILQGVMPSILYRTDIT